MNIAQTIDALRPNVRLRTAALVLVLTVAVGVSEATLYFGQVTYTIWAYSVLLFAFSLAPLLLESETTVFQAFALIPVYRLVNLTMPVFVEATLFWIPLVYGPFVPVFVYLARKTSVEKRAHPRTAGEPAASTVGIGHELPWWLGGDRGGKLRRGFRRLRRFCRPPDSGLSLPRTIIYWFVRVVTVVLLPVAVGAFLVSMAVLTVYLAEIEYDIIRPAPLVPSLDPLQLAVLAITMIAFVGFVEELLFRGVLQKVLERRLGLIPGLLLASAVFALMHSGYGLRMELVFAGGVGLLFGIVYDLTDSLVLVSVVHGLLNVLLFGVIPLEGGSSTDLLRAIVVGELQRVGLQWVVDSLPLLARPGLACLL